MRASVALQNAMIVLVNTHLNADAAGAWFELFSNPPPATMGGDYGQLIWRGRLAYPAIAAPSGGAADIPATMAAVTEILPSVAEARSWRLTTANGTIVLDGAVADQLGELGILPQSTIFGISAARIIAGNKEV